MRRNIQISFLAVVSIMLTILLGGCGSSNKEGTTTVATVDEATCRVCHGASIDPYSAQPIVTDYLASPHNIITDPIAGCQGCHGGGAEHNGVGPIPFPNPAASGICVNCHADLAPTVTPPANATSTQVTAFTAGCAHCHNFHLGQTPNLLTGNCVGCHDVTAPQHGPNLINDNNAIRAIVPEFGKRSHHILNSDGTPHNAQCAVCHLEGAVQDTPDGPVIVVNETYHMADANVHLRNADDNSDMAWNGTNHTDMDNFCFSCHDSDGALGLGPSPGAGLNALTGGSATNPFGDTLTNGYDQTTRPGVVDVKTAFTTTNASHHAVSGQRYKYRFSTVANAAVWVARDPAHRTMPPASEIAQGQTAADGVTTIAFDTADTMTGEFNLPTNQIATGGFTAPAGEGEATLFEGEKFVKTYVPLGASLTVADNSTLHCGDCHTVGQWKPGSSTSADGSATPVAIGAHGSNNEYLLRNSLGTDEIHNNLTYVCFNCHIAGVANGLKSWGAGFGLPHPNQNKNQIMGYATTHSVSAFHIQCLADSAGNTGVANRLSGSWEADKVRIYDYIPAPGATAVAPSSGSTDPFIPGSNANSGNITGIACTNCHNSGLRSNWGGIHGGNNVYVDGLGRTQTTYRFMPGMGNYRYAPPGGWDGKDVSDSTLLTQATSGVGAGKPMGGCYTNNTATENAGFSACSHHGTSTAQTTAGGQAAGFRVTYGGGTTGTPTASEPTVREATAGNAVVTRPLQY